jgi:hypothetical protein
MDLDFFPLSQISGGVWVSRRRDHHLQKACDIIIACEEGDGGSGTKVFNIEIDGLSHNHPTTRRLCQRRDDYLWEKLGVETVSTSTHIS